MSIELKKPHPDAIQTIYGWALPKTGEILVSRKNLPNPVKDFRPNRPYKEVETKETVKNEEMTNFGPQYFGEKPAETETPRKSRRIKKETE